MTLPSSVLKRFETTILKNKSVSDTAQIPAAASIAFYAQGATVSQEVVVPALEPIEPPPSRPCPSMTPAPSFLEN